MGLLFTYLEGVGTSNLMSSILRLRILGVRAFDNREPQDLEFSSPLTLICGPNGVGKTTVIECLRYVATGDLPPNAKGGAFVHDPRMSSESEVKAQVKLLFKNAAGQRMVAARSMKLSVTNKGSYSFKTLEGYIKVQDSARGETGSVGSRCADLNVQVPLALGIPPAILNYVVFCHQEDSLWPLAEPGVVKRRFDEIFEATKYTKALESLKGIRKDYMTNIRVEKVEVEHLKVDEERVKEKHQLIERLATRIEELEQDCEELQDQRRQKSKQLNDAVEHSQRVQQLSYEAKDAARQRDRIAQNLELLRDQIKDVYDEEKLRTVGEELRDSEQRQRELETEIAELRERKSAMQAGIDQAQQRLAVLANQQGRVEQLQESHNARLLRRAKITGEDSRAWHERKDRMLSELNSEIEQVELTHRQEEDVLSRSVNGLEAERLQLRQAAKTIGNNIKELDVQMKELREKAVALKGSDSDPSGDVALQTMRSRIEAIQREMAEAAEKEVRFASSNSLADSADSVVRLEKAAEAARAAVQEAIDASSAQSRLVFLRDSLSEAEARVTNTLMQLKNRLSAEKVSFTQETLEKSTRGLLEDLSAEQARESRSLENLTARVASSEKAVEAQRAHATAIEELKSKYISEFGGDESAADNYDAQVHEAEEALIASTEEQEQLQFAHKFFSRALKLAERPSHPSCLLCEHEKTPDEAGVLVSKLLAKISALSVTPEEAEADTKARRAALEELRRLKQPVEKYRQAARDLASVKEELRNSEEQLNTLEPEVSQLRAGMEQNDRRRKRLSAELEPLLQQLTRSQEEASDLERKIEIETSMAQSSLSVKTPQEAQSELEDTERDLKFARVGLDRAKSEQDRLKSRVSNLDHSIQELKLRLSEVELRNSKLKQVEQQQLEASEAQSRAQRELESVQAEVPVNETNIGQAQNELKQMKFSHAGIERGLAEKRSAIMAELQEVHGLSREISDFETTYGADPLRKLREETGEVNVTISEHSTQLKQLSERLSEVERQHIDFASYVRSYQDNLRCQRMQAELTMAEQEQVKAAERLASAKEEIGIDYERKIKLLQEAVGSLNHEISTKTGESRAVQEQMQQLRHELATTYHNTAEQYRRAVAKLQTSEGAVEDLVKYVKALDAAIMQYHSLKMAEINALLDEMWKRTYTGTDIDTIMISSESDAGSSSTRANYNYRVCMVKQDTELDMRGRCSAGQKVLASILIRMALSECFGSSSGLIVLDEPTTNLDRENIEALAQSLSDIIASRRAQRNFQLIVITHDEHFLALMSPSSYCNYYYRIERDSRQLSKVRKMPIASLS